MQHLELPQDYAIVLQQVNEYGEDDFTNLAESLRFEPSRLLHIIRALQHKGLIQISQLAGRDSWIRLSSKGQRFMRTMWPETGLTAAF